MRLRPVKAGVVADERMAGQHLQGQCGCLGQRVAARHHQHMLPLVPRQRDQLLEFVERFGGQAQHRGLVDQPLGDLARIALVQAQLQARKLLTQARQGRRQHVARLRVRGGDREPAAVLTGEFIADAAQIGHLAQDHIDGAQHRVARFGDVAQALAVAREDVHAEFLLQFEDGLGDAGLRGVQGLGGLGQVQAPASGLGHEAELLQVHRSGASSRPCASNCWQTPSRAARKAG
jgi:hypothetical protein